MKVVYFAPENSGVGYYRFHQPLANLAERGLIELKEWGFDFTGKVFQNPTPEELKEYCDWGDVFIFGRRDTPDWYGLIRLVKAFSGKPILLDIDDNIFALGPYMAAYQSYDPNGQARKIHEDVVKEVNGVVASTVGLKDIYEKLGKKAWIVPNGITHVLEKRSHGDINIGYLCSASHLENAKIIEHAVLQVLQKYTNVNFYYTKSFSGFMEKVPDQIKNQVNYVPFFPLKDYLKYVNGLNLDIGLAPLMDNDFNRCKSNIRVLEYWQNRLAVIASPLYADTITDGFDGYIAKDDEWQEKIEDLVLNPERRNYLSRNSLETLKKYDVTLSADAYLSVLREATS